MEEPLLAKLLRLFVALFAVLSLSAALAACGDDDDDASDTTSEDTRDAEEGGEDEGTDEGEGAPDENPCAEGAESPTDPEAEAPAADATPLTITAAEYSFTGGDELMTQGSYAVTLANEGQELHELALVRLADEETPLEELIASDEEPELTEVGGSFACPGTSAEPVAIEIDEPGRYVMACFIPVGTLPTSTPEELDANEGPPHAAQGMAKEFMVS
jgi:hypothetical protein